MLACQKDQFSLPDETTYLDAAALGPMSIITRKAGFDALTARSAGPPKSHDDMRELIERTRSLAARLIGADSDEIAIVGSVSHAMATVAQALRVPRGSRILRVSGEHPSNSLAWDQLALETGAVMEIVPRPPDGNWTGAVMASILRPGCPPISVAALAPVYWRDGTIIDLGAVGHALREMGACLVVDATHAVGANLVRVQVLQPDFLAFPSFKWLLGPHGAAFLYVHERWHSSEPLERNASNCKLTPGFEWDGFAAGARRYDMGELSSSVTLSLAQSSLEQALSWQPAAVAERLGYLTALISKAVEQAGLDLPRPSFRSSHILGIRAAGESGNRLGATLRKARIYVSERGGVIRVSPHVYNDEQDVERFARALRGCPI